MIGLQTSTFINITISQINLHDKLLRFGQKTLFSLCFDDLIGLEPLF